jgi:DNA polymerase I-like protein with 3'-5' exonuclease and polymerase domains
MRRSQNSSSASAFGHWRKSIMKKTVKAAPKMPTAEELWPKRVRDFVWVGPDDKRGAQRVLDIVAKNPSTALDSEFPPHGDRKDEAIIWSLSGASSQRFVLHGHWLRDKRSPFREWIEDRKTRLVYFSFPADADVIEANAKVNCERSFYADVKVEGWVRNNNKKRIALKSEGADYLNWWRKDYGAMFGYFPHGKKKWVVVTPDVIMEGPLPEEMLEVMTHEQWIELFKHYAADDAEETHTLHRVHKAVLQRWGYWDMYLKLDRPYTITLRHFQKRGIPIDFDELDRLDREVTMELVRHRTHLRLLADKPGMSLDSQSKDLRNLIFEEWRWPEYEDLQTEGGAPQLNKFAWERYANEEGFAFARWILPHNKLKTLKNTFINGIRWGTKYGPGAATNTLFSEYNQTGTKSGRMSSRKFKVRIPVVKTFKRKPSIIVEKEVKAGMNMLNFPNKYKDLFGIRRVVKAPPPDEDAPEGYGLIAGDFSGFELWMILFWCHKWGIPSKMLKHLLRGDDVHSMTAKVVCNLDCEWWQVKDLYPQKRNEEGKKSNFGLGYGAGWRIFCLILSDGGKNPYWDPRNPKIERLVRRMIDDWNDLWPEMPAYQKHCVKLGYKEGWVPTIGGGRIWVEEGLASNDEGTVRHYENLCKNGPAQGSAAVILKWAQNIIERDKKLRRMKYRQYFNVYDEIIGAAPLRYIEEATARQKWCMQQPARLLGMPFDPPVEAHHAGNWYECK